MKRPDFKSPLARTLIAATVLAPLGLSMAQNARAEGVAKGPYAMMPSTTAITVCWVSDEEASGTVQYGIGSISGRGAKTAKESKSTRYHRVILTGLRPYTRYTYAVTCQGQTKPGTFITAAPPNQPFKFVAYGDTRTQPNKHAEVLAQVQKFQPDFVIQTGDQVASGSNESQWTEFWRVASPIFSQTVYYPELGNHEDHAAPYFRYFNVPAEYSFDYGNIHFVALDSNRPESENAAQEAWLKKDLAAHQNATWRIVFFHHSIYTSVTIKQRHKDAALLRARLEPIFLAEKVQLVITGHDHGYQHHFARGIHYIGSGGGGAPLYDFVADTPETKLVKKAHHECEVTVNGATLTMRVVEPGGSVIEQFSVNAR